MRERIQGAGEGLGSHAGAACARRGAARAGSASGTQARGSACGGGGEGAKKRKGGSDREVARKRKGGKEGDQGQIGVGEVVGRDAALDAEKKEEGEGGDRV